MKRLVMVVLLAGCATQAPVERARHVSVSGGLQDQLGRAPAAEVDAFEVRFKEHLAAGREACCATLAREAPDLARELLRRALSSGDGATVDVVGRSLGVRCRAGVADRAAWATLAAAESALAGRNVDLARERARAALEGFGDDELGQARARLVLGLAGESFDLRGVASPEEARLALADPEGEAVSPSPASGDRKAVSPSAASPRFLAALRFARASRDLGLATDVESARTTLEVALAPTELADWLCHVATLALERKRPLVALRCALDAARDPGAAMKARSLVARAQLASGQAGVALDAALALAKDAHEQGDAASEGQAVGIAGEALVALERLGDAAGAFERSADLARGSGDGEAWARRTLNLARTQLRRGETADARALLETLERSVAANRRLGARVAVARACFQVGSDDYAQARASLERAIALGSEVGDPDVVEQAVALKKRLGNLGV